MGNISMAPTGVDPADHLVAWMQDIKNMGRTVKYLELGNENVTPNGWTNTQALPNGIWDLNRYLSICKDISTRVKAIFPNIKIALNCDDIGNKTGTGTPDIDALSRAIMSSGYGTSFFDAIAIHPYLRVRDIDLPDVETAKTLMFANSKVIADNIADYCRRIFPGKEIWLTESGYVKRPTDVVDVTSTLLNAIVEADFVLRWADNDDVIKTYVKFFSIAGGDNAFSH